MHQSMIYLDYFRWARLLRIQESFLPTFFEKKSLSDEDVTYIIGSDRPDSTDQSRTLIMIEAFPGDPAIYAHYISEHLGELPDNYRETVNRLDPDNGWFDEVEAAALLKTAFRTKRTFSESTHPGTGRKRRVPHQEEIADFAAIKQSIDLLHRAASKPKNTNYKKSLAERRARLAGQAYDLQTNIRQLSFVISHQDRGAVSQNTSKAISTWSKHLAENGDREEFLQLVSTVESLGKKHFDDATNPLALLIWRGIFAKNLSSLIDSAKKLDLPKIENRLSPVLESLNSNREKQKEESEQYSSFEDPILDHGSWFLELTALHATRYDDVRKEITDASLIPGNKVEQAHMAWRSLIQIFIILAICLTLIMAFQFRYRHLRGDPFPRESSGTLIFFGSVLPIAIFLGLWHFTPLSHTDFSSGGGGPKTSGIPWAGLALLLITTPVFLLKFLSRKRTENRASIWLSALLLFCPLAGITLGVFGVDGMSSVWLFCVQLAILANLIISVFSTPGNRSSQLQSSRALCLCYFTSMIIIGFLPRLYHEEEKRQTALNTLTAWETPELTHLDFLFFKSLKKNLQRIIE